MPAMLTALRVHAPYWLDDESLERLLSWLANLPGTFDELAFFTSETHAPLPVETMTARACRLGPVLARARVHGYRAGINLLATLGHHEENLPGSLDEPWQRLRDPEGRESKGCYCPEDPGYADYLRPMFTALAQAAPDFLWIDDDVRLMGHAPIAASCFCDRCVARFAEEAGRPFTRKTLAEALEGGPTPERLALRRAWLEHNRGVIARLFKLIEETVHAARPGLELGFMTGDRFYEGYAFRRWAETLSGPAKAAVRWRPGGGFYSDEAPMGLVSKAHDLGRQAAALPDAVTVVQSELENFPYHLLRKSPHTTVVESAAHMAAGCSGVAFNVIPQHPSALDEMRPILERVAAERPFFGRLHMELGRSQALGVWPAWNDDVWIVNGDPGSWFRWGVCGEYLTAPYALSEIGIPVCYDRAGATVTALAGRMPLAFSPQEIEGFMRGGVLMDVAALETLWDMGLGEMAGVRAGDSFSVDAIEAFTDHPLNDRDLGETRNCRQSFWPQDARTIRPAATGVQILSRLTDYRGNDLGECLSIFENAQGGRVAVSGYYPWAMITSGAKVWQYRALARWLSRDRLPAVVEGVAKVVVWVREGANGRRAIVVVNPSLDAQRDLGLWIRMQADRVECVPMQGASQSLSAEATSAPDYQRVVLPDLAPWSVHLLLFEAPRERSPS
ncbi:MAG: hypothetical protein JSV65_06565 [Armatimonadota bacterium]|nr:MAG: hypothetical protein JSV65_06565 [Armatimonadota bacterium]